MKFAALGRTKLLYDAICRCVDGGHEVVFIATAQAAPEYGIGEAEFATLAKKLKCPFAAGASVLKGKGSEALRAAGAEVAISVNWPNVIGASALQQFPHGVLNAHAGDLPRYRGNACPNWAILNGEPHVTLTIHEMASELDAGPILSQERFPLADDTYVSAVYDFIYEKGPTLFRRTLDGLASGQLTAQPQSNNPGDALRCLPRLPRDSEINWAAGANAVTRLVRASAEPFAGAYTFMDGAILRIWRAHAAPLPCPTVGVPGQVLSIQPDRGEVAVYAGDGLVMLTEVEWQGQRVKASDALRRTRIRLGMDVAATIASLTDRVRTLEDRLQTLEGTGDDRRQLDNRDSSDQGT